MFSVDSRYTRVRIRRDFKTLEFTNKDDFKTRRVIM